MESVTVPTTAMAVVLVPSATLPLLEKTTVPLTTVPATALAGRSKATLASATKITPAWDPVLLFGTGSSVPTGGVTVAVLL